MKRLALGLLVASLWTPHTAQAFIWAEVGDAGDLLGSAQSVTGVGALSNITGSLFGFNDVDLYKFSISNAGTFSASMSINGGSTSFDSQMFLFDSSGIGIASIDDSFNFGSNGGTITSTFVTGTGTHFIAVNSWNNEALSVGGAIFPDHDGVVIFSDVEVTNTGPGGLSPLSGWSNSGGASGTYDIAFTGAEGIAAIPEPTTLLLLGNGLLGAFGYRSIRRRKAGR